MIVGAMIRLIPIVGQFKPDLNKHRQYRRTLKPEPLMESRAQKP